MPNAEIVAAGEHLPTLGIFSTSRVHVSDLDFHDCS
jgi:hypothetical protein